MDKEEIAMKSTLTTDNNELSKIYHYAPDTIGKILRKVGVIPVQQGAKGKKIYKKREAMEGIEKYKKANKNQFNVAFESGGEPPAANCEMELKLKLLEEEVEKYKQELDIYKMLDVLGTIRDLRVQTVEERNAMIRIISIVREKAENKIEVEKKELDF